MEKEEMKSSPRKRFLSQQQANGDEVDRKIGRSNAEHEELRRSSSPWPEAPSWMICDDEEADQGQAQDDKEDGAEDEEGEKMPGGKKNGEKGKSSEWAKQAVLAKEKSVRTLMLFLLPNWKGGDVEKKKADLGSAIRTTINKLVKNAGLKLDGKYDVPESGLKLRTRGENAGWYEVWYPDFDMDPRNDQFGDVVDWSYGRVSFTLKKDAATVLELLKGSSLYNDDRTRVYEPLLKKRLGLRAIWSDLYRTSSASPDPPATPLGSGSSGTAASVPTQ